MYGQGSYNSQFGRGPPPPLQPPYRHQLPGPPPLPPHFQQGALAPPPMFQRGLPVYQRSPPVPHPAVRQISPDAGANNSQTYVHPQPAAHGSTPLPHMCSTDQQSTQLSSHLGTQNMHHMPASMPPHPPRELPPPPATVYRASVQLQSQHPGGVQDLPHMLNQPPPPTSSSFTSDPLGSFVQSAGRNSLMPSLVSLPAPPPPFDPPPSPLSSSARYEAASNVTSSSKPFCSKEGSPPPPKPTEEKVVQKIEDLCQLIAKNGPAYEDLVRQNESGNPEFEFLFAGDPLSDAAIAHEYFLWTKKKCMLACKLNERRSESPLRTSGTDSLLQSNHMEVASTTYSPADSDMEMEDDITLPGNDPGVNHSIEGTSGYDLIYSQLDVKELSHKQQMTESKNAASTAPVILEQDRVVSKHDLSALERPAPKVCSPVISSADECPLNRNLEKSATTSVDDKFSSGAPAAAQDVYSEKKSSQLIEGGSPFRLLQDYASDDISDNDREQHPDGVSPLKDSSSVAVEASRESEEIVTASITSGTTDENVHRKHKTQTYVGRVESPQDFQKKNALEDAGVEICLNGNFQKEYAEKDTKSASNSLKVDEFGRLVREGASESDSDDSHYNGREGKRGRSHSRSPLDRRRKRSLWMRRERRSRSSSWSPRKRRSRSRSPRNRRRSRSRSPRNRRRSRSRSPRNRRRSRSRSPRNRRSRSRSPRRQRNSRSPVSRRVGEFCGDGVRRDRGQIPGCFDFRRGRCYRGASCRYLHHDSEKGDGSKRHRSKQQYMEVPPFPKDSNFEGEIKHNLQKESDQQDHVVKSSKMQLGQEMPGSFEQESRLIDPHTVKSDTFKSHGDASPDILPKENSVAMPSQSKLYDPLIQNADCPPQQTDNSSISDSSPEQTSMTSVNKRPVSEALPNSIEFRHNSAQLPPPPLFSEGVTAHNMTQLPGDYNLVPESASFASQAASGERFPSYMIPGQQCNISLPPIPSWTPLPPPPPLVSSQIRPYAAELPTPSQVGDFQQRSFHPMQEPNRSISCSEDFRSKPLPPYNPQSQQFIGHGLLREDQSTHFSTLRLRTSSSFPQGDNQHVPTPFSQELSASKLQPSPADNLHVGELLKSTSQIHLHLNQPPPYSMHHSASVSSSSKFPADLQEVNQSSHPLDLRGSRNSTYYNPDASTFEQPLSSKLSSDAFRQEDTTYCSKYVNPFDMSHAQVEVRDTGSVGSRQATSSPNSPKAVGQNFPRSGGDQYDPLLDSFEPLSSLSNKTNNVKKCEPSSDSDMLRHSGSNKPLDVEENNTKKATGGVAVATTLFNEEYGESADAEVGAVENESPNNPSGAGNLNLGEIEIDQIKSPSKSKNKESRSMKLFKVALADFVKEVLKPSWREGNMSKEAFKTIVKKTVDKVSGAMKSHQIPKSQAKIDQYIVSSQRKLTKLVTGYVDKYVKM